MSSADEIQANLQRAEKLAQEDIALAQQAVTAIAQAERAIHEAGGFHEPGVQVA